MCATNPKKKRQYGTNQKETKATKDATANSKLSTGEDSAIELIYRHVGPTLLARAHSEPQSTAELLQGKDLVGFYFGASWCKYSQEFTPKLMEFYHHAAQPHGMEIIYVSSDNTQTEFHDYFATMPWLAMNGDAESARLKHNLATTLSVFKLPALVVLNVKTGHFVTDQAKQEILNLTANLESTDNTDKKDSHNDGKALVKNNKEEVLKTQGKDLVESWKTRDPEVLGTQDSTMDILARGLAYLAKNPMIAIAAVCLLVFTNTLQRMKDNPLLLVAFWLIFKRLAQEPLSRNEPYMAQTPPTKDVDDTDKDNKKDN